VVNALGNTWEPLVETQLQAFCCLADSIQLSGGDNDVPHHIVEISNAVWKGIGNSYSKVRVKFREVAVCCSACRAARGGAFEDFE
jgi:hypothetical protein